MELISVIVPVYNVEKYIHRCIDSIIRQTYTNIEIILVDDGATDESGKICDSYAKKDKRVKVIHKENGGLSDARNIGIENCNGTYIVFVDSDDYIDLSMVEKLYKNIKDNNADAKNFFKYVNIKYGIKANFSTLLLAPFELFSMIADQHIPVSLKKSTLKLLWDKEEKLLNECGKNRFRDLTDITQYLIRYVQLASGNFVPRSRNFGRIINLTDENNELKEINKKKYRTICFNDTEKVNNFEKSKKSLNSYLEDMFPQKSSYEL